MVLVAGAACPVDRVMVVSMGLGECLDRNVSTLSDEMGVECSCSAVALDGCDGVNHSWYIDWLSDLSVAFSLNTGPIGINRSWKSGLSWSTNEVVLRSSIQMSISISPRIPWLIHLSLSRQHLSCSGIPFPKWPSYLHSTRILLQVLNNSFARFWFWRNFAAMPCSQTDFAMGSQLCGS